MNKNVLATFIFLTIILLGFFVRIFWIDKSPPSLNWDEVALGYNSYSLLHTGKDEFGQSWPIVLRSFDDYKPAFYSYLSMPFIKTFGLTELGIRFLSTLSGILTICSLIILSYKIFKDKGVAFLTSLFVSLSPWGIFFSRAAFEANLGLSLFLAGITLFLGFKDKPFLAAFSFPILALTLHSYPAYKILTPLVIATLLFNQLKYIKQFRKYFYPSLILTGLILVPIVFLHLTNPAAAGRLGSTSIFNQGISWYLLPNQVISRYLSYFSPVNLFVRGSPEPTQQIPGHGMFYAFEAILIPLGIIFLLKNRARYSLFITLLLLFPIPAAITWNWFYPARVLPLFAFFSILSAIGAREIIIYFSKKQLITKVFIYSLLLFFSLSQVGSFLSTLLLYLPYQERGNWQFGMKEILTEVAKYQNEYSKVVIETRTAQPHIFTLFYTQYNPHVYQKEINKIGGIPLPRKSFNFGKYEFRDVYWPIDQFTNDVLLIGPESSLPLEKVEKNSNLKFTKVVLDKYGNVLTHIVGLK